MSGRNGWPSPLAVLWVCLFCKDCDGRDFTWVLSQIVGCKSAVAGTIQEVTIAVLLTNTTLSRGPFRSVVGIHGCVGCLSMCRELNVRNEEK